MTTRNFNVKNGLTVGSAIIDAATGNANVGNLSASQIAATANVTAPQIISNVATGTAPFIVTSTTQVANLNVATAGAATTAGTVTTNAQPNITSVGTLSSLTVSGVTNLGPVGNVIISGGTAGYYLQTNGSGTLTWASVPTGTGISNGTSNVAIPVVNGNINLSVGGNANIAVVTGTGVNVAGTLNVTGNANIGNIGTLTAVIATGNITTINSGLMQSGNSNVAIVTNGNVTISAVGGARITATSTGANVTGTLGVSGNANVGNLGASQVLATANVTAPQLVSNVATGTAPLAVTSTTLVANLNVARANVADLSTVTTISTGTYYPTFASAVSGNLVRGANSLYSANIANGSLAATTFVGNLTGPIVNGTSNVAIPTTNGNVNITSAGTTSLIVTGAGANVVGTLTASGNVIGGNLVTSGVASVTGNITGGNLVTGGILNSTGTGTSSLSGNLNMNTKWVIGLSDPVNPQDAATKKYVDDVATGLNIHASVDAATTTTLALISGGTITYNNGTSGVGATLTTTGSYTTIDTVSLVNGMRILVKDEANAAHNGIYVRTSSTVLTRASDYDTSTEIQGGDFVFVTGGAAYNSTGWVQIDNVTTVGTDPIMWEQFSGSGTYSAGAGLTLSGTEFSITNTSVTPGTYGTADAVATFTVNSRGQLTAASNTVIQANAANLAGTTLKSTVVNSSLTTVGTLSSLNVSGNVTAPNVVANSGAFYGSAAGLTGIPGANVTGTVPSATAATNASALLQNTSSATTAYPTFTTSSANGNSSAVINTGISANLGNASITATTFVGTLSGAATTAGTVTTAAQPNITSVGTLTALTVGNATANTAFGNGTITLPAGGQLSGGNLVSASFLTGTLTTAAQPNITSIGTLTTLSVTGNVTAGNIVGIFANGNSSISIPAANGNINISAAGVTNEVVITSTGVNVNGTLNATGNANVGNIAATTAIFTTGNITTINSGLIQNGTSNVTIATNGNVTINAAGGERLRLFNTGATVTGTLSVTGNANVGNIGSGAGVFTANITAGNVYANAGTIGASLLTGTLTTAAQPNITSIGSLTSLNVTGNITSENVRLNGGLTSNRANVAVSGATVIDEFAPGTFRTAKYVISASGDNGFQSVETLLVHDGTNAFITIYGSVSSNVAADIIDVTANINGVSGNVSLYAANTGPNVKVNIVSSYIQI